MLLGESLKLEVNDVYNIFVRLIFILCVILITKVVFYMHLDVLATDLQFNKFNFLVMLGYAMQNVIFFKAYCEHKIC